MKKNVYFDDFDGSFWPEPRELEPYFLAPPGKRWTFDSRNDNWALYLEGVEGTERLESDKGRIDIRLNMWGHPDLGVLLVYEKIGGGYLEAFTSKNDMSRLREWVHSLHGDPLPVGLFIPYENAWAAVKEFIEKDGLLPSSIDWIASRELPPDTFPDRFKMPTV